MSILKYGVKVSTLSMYSLFAICLCVSLIIVLFNMPYQFGTKQKENLFASHTSKMKPNSFNVLLSCSKYRRERNYCKKGGAKG